MKRSVAVLWIIISVILLFNSNLKSQSTNSRPNIVLILVDDAALMDFGCYGGEALTPNIDALAKGGTIFTNYRTSPMCAPSRSMLMTGHDSHLTGVPNLPLFIPPEYAKKPGYEGILNNKVFTIAERLKRQGYQNYIAGKWHLGHTASTLPSKRGFDRTFILDASGADNYEDRPYLPTQESSPPWFKDGVEIDLPDDFYSSKNFVDEMIQFMEEEKDVDQPFFSYLSFQAIHIPVQVPSSYTEKYIDIYKNGWDTIRQQRFEKAKALKLISEDAKLGEMLPVLRQWDQLETEDQQLLAKSMAVNAGMLEAMDEHIGRYIQYLKEKGKFDNTVFIITSDNGPEASSAGDIASMKVWLNLVGYHRDYDRLGEKGSYVYIGPEFASAAASPSAYFKFYGGEGGLRVPLIFSGSGIPIDQSRSAFSIVTDIAPTMLSIAGVSDPEEAPAGPMTGRSLYPVIQDDQATAYSSDEPVAIEAAGHVALYKGDYKLVRNGRRYGDGLFKLYNLKNDPGEISDLSKSEANKFAELSRDYEDYVEKYKVLPMGIDYDPLVEIQDKLTTRLVRSVIPWVLGVLGLILFWIIWRRRR